MSNDAEEITWSDVSEPMVRQILTQGETYLKSQLQAGIAADARATSMTSLFVTLALAVLGAGLGYWQKTGDFSPMLAGLTGGIMLSAAAGSAAWAARPIDFYFPGNEPSNWFEGRKEKLTVMLGGEAENYETHIKANDRALGGNQRAIHRAYALAVTAPLASTIAWFLPFMCSSCQG